MSLKSYGSIPYDGFTLPLASPDGRYVATQTGIAPTWPTLLGATNASPPRASGIEIYSLEDKPASNAISKQCALTRGYVLGRSANNEGFVIEAPQADGSRRIGFVRWPSPQAPAAQDPEGPTDASLIDWIVADERLNIYPALGPNGAMAWCARSVDGAGLSLVVRQGDRTFEIPPDEGQTWMLPTFAADGTLFAFRLRDGIAEVVHATPTDEEAFVQSLVAERISIRADEQRVWQSMAPVDALSAIEPDSVATLPPCLFYRSGELGRMMLWSPGTRGARPLADGSFALCMGEDGTLLWASDEGVVAVPPATPVSTYANGPASDDSRVGIARKLDGPRVYDRPAVPRRIEGQPQHFLLMVPDRRVIGVVRLTLVAPPRLVQG